MCVQTSNLFAVCISKCVIIKTKEVIHGTFSCERKKYSFSSWSWAHFKLVQCSSNTSHSLTTNLWVFFKFKIDFCDLVPVYMTIKSDRWLTTPRKKHTIEMIPENPNCFLRLNESLEVKHYWTGLTLFCSNMPERGRYCEMKSSEQYILIEWTDRLYFLEYRFLF